ncbi:MAG: non-ribosomal peptide synthetase [Firmicutes bacterium]|nr:non-ribosomal peptide synthetase [Bacillota bacterium]
MEKEKIKLLDSFNDTKHFYDRSTTVVELFEKSAEIYPDNIAVVYEENSYTYSQVDKLSSALAYYINNMGLGRGDVVSVFIPRCEYMVIASLGVLKSGCAYEPLDPSYPDTRLAFMVKDANAKLIIADDFLKERTDNFEDVSCPVLWISQISALSVPENHKEISCPNPEDLFTVIYTSGTTSIPKGVKILHRNITAYSAWYRRYFEVEPNWSIACYNSYGFDGSLTDIFPALTIGAAVIIVPQEVKLDLHALAELINRHEVKLIDLPNQVLRQFASVMKCPSLKIIVGGGEKLLPFKFAYPYMIANQYGPTETTVAVTCYMMTEYEEDIPIGKPMDNTAIYIVNSSGERVSVGEEGELWVAGEQVTGGYLNRPEETAKSFIPNPFSDEPMYSTVYRTGDIVRYRPDGNIEFVGRRDGLVKIRGFRIELDEVEKVILQYPDVEHAAAAAYDYPAGGKYIAAYVTSHKKIDIKALEKYIGENKPPYMVPSVIKQIEKIPLNQNGKFDKQALPVLKLETDEEYIEPIGVTEKIIADGFAAVFGFKRASAELDFFEVGGDSLRIMQLIAECDGLDLSLKLIYEGRTPRGMAKLLDKNKNFVNKEKKKNHFLGPLHKIHYIWGNELEDGYGVHCDATVYLGGKTDLNRLADAVEKAILAHPAVDARLTVIDDSLRWIDGDLKDIKPTIEKISREEYDKLRESIRQYMNKPETRMFVTRIFEITESDGNISKIFYFDFLHPIADGSSIEVFLEDIDRAYNVDTLEVEKFSVFDYYDQIEAEIDTDAYEKKREWNRNFVSTFTDRPSYLEGDLECKEDENETKYIMVPIGVDLAKVDKYTSEKKISIASLLAAAYGFMQASCNGETSAVGLSIYSARDDARYIRTFGALYRHYPLCVKWNSDTSADDFVRDTQNNIMLCRLHSLYEPDVVPIDSGFAYQGEDIDSYFDFCGDKALYEEVQDYEEEGFDFFIYRREDDLYCNLYYNSLRYSDSFISDFLSDYRNVIHSLVDGIAPSEIKIVTVKNNLHRSKKNE